MQLVAPAVLLLSASLAAAGFLPRHIEELIKKQVPAEPTGVKTIKSPGGVTVRYKEPGKSGVCETTPGVNSYSGYVDLDANTHMFFWFFEARSNPNEAPITLWLNGGPGSDSMIGLFEGRSMSIPNNASCEAACISFLVLQSSVRAVSRQTKARRY